MIIKKILPVVFSSLALMSSACSDNDNDGPDSSSTDKPVVSDNLAEQNVGRAIEIIDAAVDNYFTGTSMAMSRYYNPHTGQKSQELGSVWMYTSSIEAVNAVLHSLKTLKDNGSSSLYDANFERYKELLSKLVEGAEYYRGSFSLTSYTGTNTWNVLGVDRGSAPGAAFTEGIHNVYDDQMWFIREMVESYNVTGENKYLEKAEYLTSYVLDGWDCTLDENGKENGGFTWGPCYVTKHACSNGPIISPLVWLHEIYKGKPDMLTYKIIDADNKRVEVTKSKADRYLEIAKATYDWQKSHLLDPSNGVYSDMMGGDDNGGNIKYETVDGELYRAHSSLRDRVGEHYTYNSGSTLSGLVDLYRVTSDASYLTDIKALTDNSFVKFATLGSVIPDHYAFNITGFRPWFDGVLMRAYVEAAPVYNNAATCADAFQANLDYAYDNFRKNHQLPTNLLVGWNYDKAKNNTEAMFEFGYAAEYAVLARHQLNK